MDTFVRLHPDDIKALSDRFGTKYQTPDVPHDNGRIPRGLKSIILGGSFTGGIREFQILPFPTAEPNPRVNLQVVGYSVISDVVLTDALLWVVEVNSPITGTAQALAIGEFCNTPDQIRTLYPTMLELSDKYVRTLGPFSSAGNMAWLPLDGNAGLLEKGSGLALCMSTVRNTEACIQGVVVAREYNTR